MSKGGLLGFLSVFSPDGDVLGTGLNVIIQQTGVYPYPLRGVCETKSKKGRSRYRRILHDRVYSARRGIETMVSEGARPCGMR